VCSRRDVSSSIRENERFDSRHLTFRQLYTFDTNTKFFCSYSCALKVYIPYTRGCLSLHFTLLTPRCGFVLLDPPDGHDTNSSSSQKLKKVWRSVQVRQQQAAAGSSRNRRRCRFVVVVVVFPSSSFSSLSFSSLFANMSVYTRGPKNTHTHRVVVVVVVVVWIVVKLNWMNWIWW
jgi:hypothetical protein